MSEVIFHLGTFAHAGHVFVGLVLNDRIVELNQAAAAAEVTLPRFTVLAELLVDWDKNFDSLRKVAEKCEAIGMEQLQVLPLDATRPLAPLGRFGKLLYAAANYRDHVANITKTFTPAMPLAGGDKPLPALRPYMFGKICKPTGAFDDIVLPAGLARTDWEAELMVVIGAPGHNIPGTRAKAHIAGYMTTNDVSCRDLTWREDRPSLRSDWLSGKSFDSFAPVGPYFTPAAFIPDHSNVPIRLWVNGELKQDGNSADMIFGIEEQIEYASRMMTLEPGDLIATGTPAGTGQERLEFLKAGDIVETEVGICGRQRNAVKAGSADYSGTLAY